MTTTKKTAVKTTADKAVAKKTTTKRTLVEPHPGDKRYVRRDSEGQFEESDDVSKSLSQDVRKHAKTAVQAGQGDKGDRATPVKKAAKKTRAAGKS